LATSMIGIPTAMFRPRGLNLSEHVRWIEAQVMTAGPPSPGASILLATPKM
jgi:hypothetical protein